MIPGSPIKSAIVYYVDGRVFEWYMTVSMLGLAACMSFDPHIITASAFQWVGMWMPGPFITVFMFLMGWLRMIGLVLNGHRVRGVRVGPIIRAVTAAFCAVMWVQFAAALLIFSVAQGFMSPGVPFWMTAVLAELYLSYRVMARSEGTA